VFSLDGKRALRRPRCGWEVLIKMHLPEVGWRDMELIAVAQDRDRWQAQLNGVMKF
jgi:hypothetical protein